MRATVTRPLIEQTLSHTQEVLFLISGTGSPAFECSCDEDADLSDGADPPTVKTLGWEV